MQLDQSALWNTESALWRLQEEAQRPIYEAILESLGSPGQRSLIDIGCGTRDFLQLASERGFSCSGADIAQNQIDYARSVCKNVAFEVVSMESLHYPDESFHVAVCNNSLQFSADPLISLQRIWRMIKPGGHLVVTLWTDPRDSDAFGYFKVLYRITGQPELWSLPFNLSRPGQLEELMVACNFTVVSRETVRCPRVYHDMDTALSGLMSSGPARMAINQSSTEQVREGIAQAILPFRNDAGEICMVNSFSYCIARKHN